MPNYDSLLSDATQLPVDARIQLIDALWDSLPDEAMPRLSEEWLAEIRRRSAEFDVGSAQSVPWEQVRAEALKRAGLTTPNEAR